MARSPYTPAASTLSQQASYVSSSAASSVPSTPTHRVQRLPALNSGSHKETERAQVRVLLTRVLQMAEKDWPALNNQNLGAFSEAAGGGRG